MYVHLLDNKNVGNSQWYLVKVSLVEYLNSLDDFFDFNVQRGIVTNDFLDKILDSIAKGQPLPPITIVANMVDGNNIGSFHILDGLQRTYRLWLYWRLYQIYNGGEHDCMKCQTTLLEEAPQLYKIIKFRNLKQFLNGDSEINVSNILQKYSDFEIYLYVWQGLTEKEIINEMLKLNVGQKRVSLAHQFELLYLSVYKNHTDGNIKLVRTKDDGFNDVKTGRRKIGEFLFSSVIIGLRSFIQGKPVRLQTKDVISPSNDNDITETIGYEFYNTDFVEGFIRKLYQMDIALSHNDERYLKWFVKDTTLSGVWGAIGDYVRKKHSNDIDFYHNGIESLDEIINRFSSNDVYRLDEFDNQYGKLSSVRVNIGSIVRIAIYLYTKDLLEGNLPSWNRAFLTKSYE